GQLLPCNFLQFSLGRIGEKPIADMRADLLRSPWFCGTVENCLCGENDDFISRYIVAYKGEPKPLDAYAVFGLNDDGKMPAAGSRR
ncbi:hypothetical protein JZU57_00375, partial [bacterium]|nr:hypothetical protein [bacterium]